MRNNRKLLAATAMAAALVLAGCWDDDDDQPTPVTPVSTEVPSSAGVGTASFVSFLLTLAGNDESSEPLTINDSFAVPADEAAEPTTLV